MALALSRALCNALANFVDRANVRVIERRRRARRAPQTLQQLRVARRFRGEEFQRDVASQIQILSFVHHSHPAAAQLFQDAVMGNCVPDQRIVFWHRRALWPKF